MDISPNVLRKDTVMLIKQIDRQIDEVNKEAFRKNIEPSQVRDAAGGWSLAPMLLAKTMAYNTLVMLQNKK